MAQQQPPRWQEARRRQYNGSQIVANLQRMRRVEEEQRAAQLAKRQEQTQ
jgi:hypothetical protein